MRGQRAPTRSHTCPKLGAFRSWHEPELAGDDRTEQEQRQFRLRADPIAAGHRNPTFYQSFAAAMLRCLARAAAGNILATGLPRASIKDGLSAAKPIALWLRRRSRPANDAIMTGALLASNGVFDVSLDEAQLHCQRWTGASTPTGIDGLREEAGQESPITAGFLASPEKAGVYLSAARAGDSW
jgi:hypothetical protein